MRSMLGFDGPAGPPPGPSSCTFPAPSFDTNRTVTIDTNLSDHAPPADHLVLASAHGYLGRAGIAADDTAVATGRGPVDEVFYHSGEFYEAEPGDTEDTGETGRGRPLVVPAAPVPLSSLRQRRQS